jgi:hypothetical protein
MKDLQGRKRCHNCMPQTAEDARRFKPCLLCRMAQVEDDLQAFKASHVLASGEYAEVLSEAEQDARSWALIEKWHTKCDNAGVLNVEFLGPFDYCAATPAGQKVFFYARLPGGHMGRGHTRSDALAHAAEWCKGLL